MGRRLAESLVRQDAPSAAEARPRLFFSSRRTSTRGHLPDSRCGPWRTEVGVVLSTGEDGCVCRERAQSTQTDHH